MVVVLSGKVCLVKEECGSTMDLNCSVVSVIYTSQLWRGPATCWKGIVLDLNMIARMATVRGTELKGSPVGSRMYGATLIRAGLNLSFTTSGSQQ